MEQVRAKAIGAILDDDRLFVVRAFDPGTNEVYFVPPGGKIEFGESGAECVVREIEEEIGARVNILDRIGVLEHIFTFNNEPRHELILIFLASFVDPKYSSIESVPIEDNGQALTAEWMALSEFREGRALLGPEGLLDLVMAAREQRDG